MIMQPQNELDNIIDWTIFTNKEKLVLEDIMQQIIAKGQRGNENWHDYESYKAMINRKGFNDKAYVETLRGIVYLLKL